MTTKEAAEKWNSLNPSRKAHWNSNSVARYCKQGVVIDAEKRGWSWFIPDDAPEPLVTKKRASQLLRDILTFHEGGDPMITGSVESIVDEYEYLVALGYCKRIRWIKSDEARTIGANTADSV